MGNISKKRTWDVYRLICRTTNKSYVGKGNTNNRWRDHKRTAKKGLGFHLHAAIRLYGEDDFDIITIATFFTQAAAYEFEAFLIETEDLRHNGYNEAPGMIIRRDFDKVDIQRSITVGKSWSSDRRKIQSERYKGLGNPFYGRRHNENTRLKLSKATATNVAAHKKISKKLRGHKVSSETRNKMSQACVVRGKTLEEAYGIERATEIKSTLKQTQPDRRGENHPSAKLTTTDVLNIRSRSLNRETDKTLAIEFDVSECTIRKIRLRYVWKHI